MSKASRDKGQRTERGIVAKHQELGVTCERVPLSGGTRYQGNGGDIDIEIAGRTLHGEIKARGNGGGFATIERWLSGNDLLFLKRDRQEPLVVLAWRTWRSLMQEFSHFTSPTHGDNQ